MTLVDGLPEGTVHFVLLDGSPEMIAARLAARHHEFMNAKLLESQFKTLEPPKDDHAFTIVNDREPAVIVQEILAHVAPGSE